MGHECSLDALNFFLADVRQGLGAISRSFSYRSGTGRRIKSVL
jgi:hypothetical protein